MNVPWLILLGAAVAACDGRPPAASDQRPVKYAGPCTETVFDRDQTVSWVRTFRYDNEQRMVGSESLDGSELVACDTRTYDGHDNPLTVVDCGPPARTPGGGQYSYVYDAAGRVLASTFTPAADWNPITVDSYDYDSAGLRLHRRTRTVPRGGGGDERELLITYSYEPGPDGHLVGEESSESRTDYRYDERGYLAGQATYDFFLHKVVWPRAYTTDEAGNRLTESWSAVEGEPLRLGSTYTYECWANANP